MCFHKSRLTGAALFCLTVGSMTVAGQEKESTLPDGPGKESLVKVCSNCHEVETVTATRRTRIGWQQMTEDMIGRGADGSEEEMAAVVSYLTTFFGKVNINTASAQQLEKTLDFPAKEAQAIVAYREKNGKISDFEELRKVPGVSADKLQSKRPLIAFAL
jgi:competence ComEA-like helix-hairpin-helix protein